MVKVKNLKVDKRGDTLSCVVDENDNVISFEHFFSYTDAQRAAQMSKEYFYWLTNSDDSAALIRTCDDVK